MMRPGCSRSPYLSLSSWAPTWTKSIRPVFITVLILVCTAFSFAQDLTFRGPDPTSIRLGQEAQVILEVAAPPTDVALAPMPVVDGLNFIVGKPELQTRPAPSTSWTITLSPRRAGPFDVPGFAVDIAGETHRTEAFRFTVTPDEVGTKHAFVERIVPDRSPYVGETFIVRLRFGVDRDFFERQAVSLFRRELDVEVQIEVDDARDVSDGTSDIAAPVTTPSTDEDTAADPDSTRSFVFGQAISRAREIGERDIDGRTFVVYELVERRRGTRAAVVAWSEAHLRFAWTTKHEEDLFGDRRPVDRHGAFIASSPSSLEILPLPDSGRPENFTGVVGPFTLEAQCDRTSVAAGESFELRVVVARPTGSSTDLSAFDSVVWPEPTGFKVYGCLERPSDDGTTRTFVYDVAARSDDVDHIPTIRLAYFDPEPPGRYRFVETEPVAIGVTLGTNIESPVPAHPRDEVKRPTAGDDDIFGLKTSFSTTVADNGRPWRPGRGTLGAWLLAPWVISVGVFLWSKRREFERRHPAVRRARRAANRFRSARSRATTEEEVAAVFVDYLAARLACSPALVVDDELTSRLVTCGVADDLAQRTTLQVVAMTDARYGGPTASIPSGDVARLVDELELSFRQANRADRPRLFTRKTMGAAAVSVSTSVLAAAVVSPPAQTDADETMRRAVAAYESGEFEAARRAFGQILESVASMNSSEAETTRGIVHYDLGNCHFRLGNFPEAVLHYRRAERRRYHAAEIQFNLALAQKRLGLEPSGSSIVERCRDSFHRLDHVMRLAVVVLLKAMGLIGMIVFRRRLGIVALFAILLFFGILGAIDLLAEDEMHPRAVILAAEAGMRAQPHRDLPVIVELRPGETVTMIESSSRWARIRRAGGEGWVERSDLGLVD